MGDLRYSKDSMSVEVCRCLLRSYGWSRAVRRRVTGGGGITRVGLHKMGKSFI